jgi:hypothetical protein
MDSNRAQGFDSARDCLAPELGLGTAVALPFAAKAATPSTVVVTPTNTQGWATADTRTGGAVSYVSDSTAPGDPSYGALKLTTDATTAAKVQYMHQANVPLGDVTDLSYSTKQNSASFPGGLSRRRSWNNLHRIYYFCLRALSKRNGHTWPMAKLGCRKRTVLV